MPLRKNKQAQQSCHAAEVQQTALLRLTRHLDGSCTASLSAPRRSARGASDRRIYISACAIPLATRAWPATALRGSHSMSAERSSRSPAPRAPAARSRRLPLHRRWRPYPGRRPPLHQRWRPNPAAPGGFYTPGAARSGRLGLGFKFLFSIRTASEPESVQAHYY
jgi:hypothetical protein